MDKQTFMLFGGFIIAALGFAYIVSKRFALAYFYVPRYGIINSLRLPFSEKVGVFLIRFVLGPIMLITGSRLVFVAL